MDNVYSLVRGICIFIIITTIVDNLLQGSVFRKYVRLVSGIMITLIIINPLLELISLGDTYAASVEKYINKLDIDEYGRDIKMYTDINTTPSYYKDMLNQSLKEYLETEGYEMADVNWNIVNDSADAMYGRIEGLKVAVYSGGGHTIDKVHIDENGQIELYNRELEEKLAEYYGISADKVKVVID